MTALRQSQRDAAAAKRKGVKGGSRKPLAVTPDRVLGEQYSPGAYRKAVKTACKRAGVPLYTPYALRHLAAAVVKSLYDLDAVQALLGHHTRTMAEHYGGVAFAKAAKVAKSRGG